MPRYADAYRGFSFYKAFKQASFSLPLAFKRQFDNVCEIRYLCGIDETGSIKKEPAFNMQAFMLASTYFSGQLPAKYLQRKRA